MSDAEYNDQSAVVFFPAISGTLVTMEVASAGNLSAKTTLGCCDIMRDRCDRENVTQVTLRVKDPAGGRTTRVYSNEGTAAWSRVSIGGAMYSESDPVPVPPNSGEEAVIGLLIYLDDSANTSLRRTQVVIIRHAPN